MSAFSLHALHVATATDSVLRGIDLEVESGEFVVLLGPSGCGKTTLLNAVAGLYPIHSGSVFIGGRDVTDDEPQDRGIGMVFQSYALYPRMSVAANLSFALRVAGVKRAEIERRVSEVARLLRIDGLLERRPSQLSGGQRQRVAIGRALVRDAQLFLFDEPLSNIDAALRSELRIELKRLHRAMPNSTMLYVTHDQVEAMTLADRIAVMQRGKVVQFDTPRHVYRRPANRFVAGFVGAPRMNFLGGVIERRHSTPLFIHGDHAIDVSGYPFEQTAAGGRQAELGIRPEHVELVDDTGDAKVTVELNESMGAETVIWVAFGHQSLAVRLPGDAPLPAGARRGLRFPVEHLHLFDADTGARL